MVGGGVKKIKIKKATLSWKHSADTWRKQAAELAKPYGSLGREYGKSLTQETGLCPTHN